MMSMQLNTLQKPERFDLYVGKLRSICEMHGIRTGSRGDLSSFLQTLTEDRHFSMDFWGLAGKLSNREGGELSDDQMLAVVVTGITGADVPEDDSRMTHTLEELRALL